MKEPGQLAYETRFQERPDPRDEFLAHAPSYRAIWANVERAIRNAALREAAEAIECAVNPHGYRSVEAAIVRALIEEEK